MPQNQFVWPYPITIRCMQKNYVNRAAHRHLRESVNPVRHVKLRYGKLAPSLAIDEPLVVMSVDTREPRKAGAARGRHGTVAHAGEQVLSFERREAYLRVMTIANSYANLPDLMVEGLESLHLGTAGDIDRINAFCALWSPRQ